MDPARGLAVLVAIRDGLDHIPGELLVKFKPGTDTAAMASVMSLASASSTPARARWIGDVALLSFDAAAPVDAVARRLALEPEVEYAQPNRFLRVKSTPNDPGLSRQWNFTVLEMEKAWAINDGAPDITIAVVDTGITNVDANIRYRLWTGNDFENVSVPYRMNPDIDAARFVDGIDTTSVRLAIDGPAQNVVNDTNGHGTHVAGTALQSTGNEVGFVGMAYNARLMPVKACFSYWDAQFFESALGTPGFVPPSFDGGCITSDVIAAIRFAADHGAHVINLSLGGPGTSPADREAIEYAVGRGAFVAMAVGNAFEDGNPVEYPAGYGEQIEGAMAVAAVGRNLQRASYSNTGTHVEIAAPGGDFRDGGLAGTIFQTGLLDGDFRPDTVIRPRFDRYQEQPKQGTSMAAPHVAGLAALIRSQGITDPAAIEAAILRFARDLGPAGRDPQFGHGLIDPRKTLRGLGLAR